MRVFCSTVALCLLLFSGLALAAGNKPGGMVQSASDSAVLPLSSGSWQTTVTRNKVTRQPKRSPRHIGRRGSSIASLRAEAIQISLKHLPRLRPYASNYPRMVRAVRAYWQNNITRPDAARLTAIIMRHVQSSYRFFIRARLRAGITRGINVLKRKLHRS